MFRKLLIALVVLVVLAVGLYFVAARVLGSGLMRTTLEQQLSARLGQPVRIGSASAAIYPRVAIDLRDVSVGSPAGLTAGRVRLVTGLRPLLSRIIQDAEVILEDGELRLPLPFDLFPSTSGTAAPQPAGAPLTVRSIQVIELRRFTLAAGDERWVVDADCTIAGDRLDVTRLSTHAKTTRLHGSGAVTSLSRTEAQFIVTGDPLDLDELMAFGSAATGPSPGPVAASGTASPMRIDLSLTAPSGTFAAHQFRDLSTTTIITSGSLSLAPLAVAAFGGRFNGRIDADTRKAVPLLRLNGRIDGLDVAEVLKAAGSEGGITGRLAGTVALSAAGTDSDALLRTARGSIAAAITNGTMPRLELVRPIVLAFGKPSGTTPGGSGSSFSRLGGTFALANGVVTSNDISMASRDFDLNGAGSVALVTGAISGRGDVRLSSELTAQAGVDLRRYAQEDGRVVVPATFAGTLQQPAVTLDVAAATRRALGNEIQRRAKGLFDDLFGRRKK
jgi:uncharacterized protein involved in outer membrane biogenesis